MSENKVVPFRQEGEIDDPLTEILRAGAKRLIEQAAEAEFAAFLTSHGDLKLADGRQRVVRHGHDPVRPIQKGIGPVEVEKPKARDRGASSAEERIRYSSSILPKWALRELCGILGDGVNQAADFFSDATSIPSRNVTPLTTFGV